MEDVRGLGFQVQAPVYQNICCGASQLRTWALEVSESRASDERTWSSKPQNPAFLTPTSSVWRQSKNQELPRRHSNIASRPQQFRPERGAARAELCAKREAPASSAEDSRQVFQAEVQASLFSFAPTWRSVGALFVCCGVLSSRSGLDRGLAEPCGARRLGSPAVVTDENSQAEFLCSLARDWTWSGGFNTSVLFLPQLGHAHLRSEDSELQHLAMLWHSCMGTITSEVIPKKLEALFPTPLW